MSRVCAGRRLAHPERVTLPVKGHACLRARYRAEALQGRPLTGVSSTDHRNAGGARGDLAGPGRGAVVPGDRSGVGAFGVDGVSGRERQRGPHRYRALPADRGAQRRALRPKPVKLVRCRRLRRVVERKLEARWSPQQISAWLAAQYPNDPEMQVSQETIYQSLFVQSRGALRKELHSCLRSGRAMRRAKAYTKGGTGQGQLRDMVMISDRPPEVADRAVPGHWEGDLIFGKKMTAIGTLVERHSRYVILLKLPNGHGAHAVRTAMTKRILTLPAQLRRSITWDQGKEMAEHVQFTLDTGVQIYFCDPKSPWQRGSNENTNGLLRQYLPKTTDLSQCTQRELDAIARSLNTRPRQTLGWMTPSQTFANAVATTA